MLESLHIHIRAEPEVQKVMDKTFDQHANVFREPSDNVESFLDRSWLQRC